MGEILGGGGAALIWGSAIFGFGERECKNENDEIEGLS
jgi:hypothetical protein